MNYICQSATYLRPSAFVRSAVVRAVRPGTNLWSSLRSDLHPNRYHVIVTATNLKKATRNTSWDLRMPSGEPLFSNPPPRRPCATNRNSQPHVADKTRQRVTSTDICRPTM